MITAPKIIMIMTSKFIISTLLSLVIYIIKSAFLNFSDSQSEIDDPVYDTPRYVGSNDSESSDDSEESEDDREYDRDSNIGFRSQRHSYYSSSNEALSSSARRNNPRLVMGNDRTNDQLFRDDLEDIQDNFSSILQDSTARPRSISRNRPRPDSMRYVSHHSRVFDSLNDRI